MLPVTTTSVLALQDARAWLRMLTMSDRQLATQSAARSAAPSKSTSESLAAQHRQHHPTAACGEGEGQGTNGAASVASPLGHEAVVLSAATQAVERP